MNNLIVGLSGGLGNQLFQYAAGRALSLRLGCNLTLDTSWYYKKENRFFVLNKFSMEDEEPIKKISVSNNLGLFFNRANRRFSRYIYGLPIFKEKKFSFNEDFNSILRPVYLEGYWQSERYFIDIRHVILRELQLKDGLPEKCKNILEDINASNSVCVHIRRGDYVNNKIAAKLHSICALDYYHKAINLTAQKLKKPKFFIFSDDMEWAKKSIFLDYEMRFVDVNTILEPHLDLTLMSACKCFIIANSTLSWWAAWAAKNESKLVIAPKKWFVTNDRDLSDIVPREWKKI